MKEEFCWCKYSKTLKKSKYNLRTGHKNYLTVQHKIQRSNTRRNTKQTVQKVSTTNKTKHSAGKHAHILGTLYGVLIVEQNFGNDLDPHKIIVQKRNQHLLRFFDGTLALK